MLVIHRAADCGEGGAFFTSTLIMFQSDLRSQFAERVSLALLGSAGWERAPLETDSMSSTLRARRSGYGLGDAPPGRFPAGRARCRRERPEGRAEKTCRPAKKNYITLLYTWYVSRKRVVFSAMSGELAPGISCNLCLPLIV